MPPLPAAQAKCEASTSEQVRIMRLTTRKADWRYLKMVTVNARLRKILSEDMLVD